MNKELERNKINKEDKTVWDVFGIHYREKLWVGGNRVDIGEKEREVQTTIFLNLFTA